MDNAYQSTTEYFTVVVAKSATIATDPIVQQTVAQISLNQICPKTSQSRLTANVLEATF
ncbi:hypothetical protein Q8344_004586 [Vibrio harveyi]|nr:hypothetical protein [Vibrio harveyi]